MSRRSEREIVRLLSERGDVEPPADLLARLRSEIPAHVAEMADVAEVKVAPAPVPSAEPAREDRFRSRQRWLLAASLVAMVGAGLFSLRVYESGREGRQGRERSVPPRAVSAPQTSPAAKPAMPAPAEPPEMPRSAARPEVRKASPPPAAPSPSLVAPPPLVLERRQAADAASPARPREEQPEGGIAGGTRGGVPEPAALPPSLQGDLAGAERNEAGVVATAEESTKTAAAPLSAAAAPRAKAMQQDLFRAVPAGGFVDAAVAPRDVFRAGRANRSAPDARRLSAGESREELVDAMAGVGSGKAAEGAPSPFTPEERRRLLLFRLADSANPANAANAANAAEVEVDFDPTVVARYRRVSAGAVALYEIELQPAAAAAEGAAGEGGAAVVATLPGGARLRLADLARSWEEASAGFRLASLAAKLVELAELRPGARPRGELAELRRRARILAAELPGDRRAAELLERIDQVERVERLSP